MIKIPTDFNIITHPNDRKNQCPILVIFVGSFILLIIWLGYFVRREDFPALVGAYGLSFLLYGLVNSFVHSKKSILFWIVVGILLRIILLFSIPNLSDDLYRFIWDGRLIINGFNPFSHLPNYYIENQILPKSLTLELYDKLNSKPYFTIYPPVAQVVFSIACWLFPKSIFGSMVVMKFILLLGELGSIVLIIKLLQQFKLPKKNILLYVLNPLIIIEIVSNVHLEGLMIFFLLLALWFTTTNRWVFSAITMSFAIAVKLIPLIFLPFLIARFGFKKSLFYFTIVGTTLLILFAPLLNTVFIKNVGNSLNLYFRQFEFNASIYYLVRSIEYQTLGYNNVEKIGPVLAIITFFNIILIAILKRDKTWQKLSESWLFAISIYLLFATTVHPWYLTPLVALSVFTRWRYAIIWSGVVLLSYAHYWDGNFKENYALIGVEYGIVFATFLYELSKSRVPTAH